MKKIFRYAVIVLFAFILVGSAGVRDIQAETLYSRYTDNRGVQPVSYGQCGQNAFWSFIKYNGEGILLITGQGLMDDYTYYSSPWNADRREITQVIISDGITHIGSNAFYYFSGLRSVSIGPDVLTIGSNAFSGCYALLKLHLGNQLLYLETRSVMTGNDIYFAGSRDEWEQINGKAAAGYSNVHFAYDDDYDLSKNGEITIDGTKFTYNKQAQKPAVTVKVKGKILSNVTDYTLTYSNNTNAGKATISATGKGNYKGTVSAQFVIEPVAIQEDDVPKITDQKYNGKEIKPGVKITLKNFRQTTLTERTDYTVTYSNNINVGKATATILGTGNYTGTIKRTFQIQPVSLETATVTNLYDKSYTGEEVTQSPTVKMYIGGKTVTLRNTTDYTLSYKNNKSAGTATVTIKGQGNYTGSINKTFKITKGSASVKFEKETVTSNKIGATFTNKITTTSKGKKSFKSSNANVAKVNSKGEVTTKGYGTATITVTIAATDDFNETTAKYTVNVVKTIGWADLRYSFCNSRSDFGYPKDYKIPYARYKMVFGDKADSVYRQYGDKLWGGNCFGMSTSTSLMNNSNCSIKMKEFKASATKVSDLRLSNHSDQHDLTLKQYIEVMQISQYCSAKSREIWANYNDLEGLVKAVKDVATNGRPVIVAIYSETGGHAVVGYEIEKVNSEKTRLRIYDPNFPDEKRSITLYTKDGKYTGWYYKMNDVENWGSKYKGCWISYNTYSVYETLWSGKSSPLNSFVTNSQNFVILDKNGQKVAEMTEGVFNTESDQIHEVIPLDVIMDDHVIALPIGNYQFVNMQEDLETLTLSTLDTVLSFNAENTAMTAAINTDATVSMVSLEPLSNVTYEVSFDSLVLQEQGIEDLTFVGVGKGDPLMVGVDDGQYVFENCEELKVYVNGDIVEELVPGSSGDSNNDEPVGTGK